MRTVPPLAVLLAMVCSASAASAQVFHVTPVEQKAPSRAFLGIDAEYGQAHGEFADFVDHSWGVGGSFLYAMDRAGLLGLRVDMSYQRYGHERQRVPLSPTIGGRILVDVTTDNNIVLAGVGPQLLFPRGPVMPYLTGTIGLAYFFTQSSVEGADNNDPFATTKNYSNTTFAWSGAGGLYIALKKGAKPVALDLGARYQANGTARYLREGGIIDNGDGTITLSPTRSEANLIIYHIGLTFGL